MVKKHVHLLGISKLDQEHLLLGYIIAELELAAEQNAHVAAVSAITARLIQAARAHFAHEEKMMERDGYPLLNHHRESHAQLIRFVEALASQLAAGHIQLDKELLATLWDWETGHIEYADREYADFIRERHRHQTSSPEKRA